MSYATVRGGAAVLCSAFFFAMSTTIFGSTARSRQLVCPHKQSINCHSRYISNLKYVANSCKLQHSATGESFEHGVYMHSLFKIFRCQNICIACQFPWEIFWTQKFSTWIFSDLRYTKSCLCNQSLSSCFKQNRSITSAHCSPSTLRAGANDKCH